jgi:hypothetical protein
MKEVSVLVFESLPYHMNGDRSLAFTPMMRRAKIPGGWLVGQSTESLVFVPDPGHAWDGSSLP